MYSVVIMETETIRRPQILKCETLGQVETLCKQHGLHRVNEEVLEPQFIDRSQFLTYRPTKAFVLDSEHNLVDLRDLRIMKYDRNI